MGTLERLSLQLREEEMKGVKNLRAFSYIISPILTAALRGRGVDSSLATLQVKETTHSIPPLVRGGNKQPGDTEALKADRTFRIICGDE